MMSSVKPEIHNITMQSEEDRAMGNMQKEFGGVWLHSFRVM